MQFELPDLFNAEKVLATTGRWTPRTPLRNSDWLEFIAPLEIDGATIAGLRLRATVIRDMPDRAITCQLEYHRPRQHGAALSRIEWRPLKGHNNKGLGPMEYRYKQIRDCHIHPFDENWRDAAKALRRGNLPIAIPLAPSPDDFAALLERVGKEFNIKGIEIVPVPPWVGKLV